jgi:hypothetical protein
LPSSGSNDCDRPGIYVNVTYYLDWIKRVRLDDVVQDFREAGGLRLPYDKMDSPLLMSMFERLAEEPQTELRS